MRRACTYLFHALPNLYHACRLQVLLQYNRDTNALIRRRVRSAAQRDGSGAVAELRIPPAPIPTSWGRTVQPYEPPEALAASLAACSLTLPLSAGGSTAVNVAALAAAAGSQAAAAPTPSSSGSDRGTCYCEVTDVVRACGHRQLLRPYQAVMINCGWEAQWEREGEEAVAASVANQAKGAGLLSRCAGWFLCGCGRQGAGRALFAAVCAASEKVASPADVWHTASISIDEAFNRTATVLLASSTINSVPGWSVSSHPTPITPQTLDALTALALGALHPTPCAGCVACRSLACAPVDLSLPGPGSSASHTSSSSCMPGATRESSASLHLKQAVWVRCHMCHTFSSLTCCYR